MTCATSSTGHDGIDVDTMKLKDVVFDSVEENRRNIRIATRKKDYDSIKKVINALQSCPPAWPLGSESRKDTPSKSRAVRAELDAPLREIVKKSFNMSLDVNVSHMPNQDRFEFEFKQRQDEDDEDDEDVIDNEQDADDKLDLKHKWTTFLFPPSKTRERIEELIEALGVSLPTGGNDNADDTTGIDTMHEDPLSTTVLVPPFTQANPAAIMVPLDNPASGHMPVPIHPSALDDNNDTNDDDDESMYWKDIDTASGGLVRTQPIDDDEGIPLVERSVQSITADIVNMHTDDDGIQALFQSESNGMGNEKLDDSHDPSPTMSSNKRNKPKSIDSMPTSPPRRPPQKKRPRTIHQDQDPPRTAPSTSTPAPIAPIPRSRQQHPQQPDIDMHDINIDRVEEGYSMP
ncbi:hypothetical protein JVU11DRAFT_12466 [Chiua virens]|nr:hypothetical protein JVU11DRAFT_12466 [Chiua virens]